MHIVIFVLSQSTTEDVDRICEWGEAQPRTIDTRRELLRRYAEVIRSHVPVLKFMQHNQAALSRLDRGSIFRKRQKRLHALLVDEDGELIDRLRAWDALTTLYSAWITYRGTIDSEQELREASLRISIGLLEANHARQADERSQD